MIVALEAWRTRPRSRTGGVRAEEVRHAEA
jgi:hypothetical protein